MESAVRQHLYWPDGTIRKRTRSYLAKKGSDRTRKIVQALVDKYNEDHNLLKVCPLSLLPVLNPWSCFHWYDVSYCLFNLTTADLFHSSYFRMMHTNLKMFCTANQFVRTRIGTIIWISLHIKGLVQIIVKWKILSSRKSNVWHKNNIKNCWSAVSAQLMTVVLYYYILFTLN